MYTDQSLIYNCSTEFRWTAWRPSLGVL